MSASSFRNRLQLKHNQHQLHIQTQHHDRHNTSPWPGGGGGGGSPGKQRAASMNFSASPAGNAGSTSAVSITRPPLSPRGYSSAAALTGQSRFVEGSMNDRVSAVPPAGFLGFENEDGITGLAGEYGLVSEVVGGGGGGGAGGYGVVSEQRGFGAGVGGDGGGSGRGYGAGTVGGGANTRYHLRRPRSTASWVRSGTATTQPPPPHEQHPRVVKKTSFLAPLWDGVREKLHLSKSKSSGSIGRVVNSVVGGGGGGAGERRVDRERVAAEMEERQPAPPVQPPSTTGYPSREEVLESYKSLVASGFFEAHAIRGGRHPLRSGNGQAPEGKSFAQHTATPTSPGRRSFAEHMAAPGATGPSPAKSFADHMAAVQSPKPAVPFSSPTRNTMAPPPPPRASSQRNRDTVPSPQRGTKRGASIDIAGDAEMVTRKLVKKLRHSASRLSVELTGARDSHYHSYGTARSRISTSSNPPGPLSPTSSVFSGISSPPSIADDTMSIRHGKLSKAKDGRRRRILGLTRRHRSPAPAAAPAEADPDAMMIDEPEPEQQQPGSQPEPSASTEQGPKIHRIITPPPAAFRTHYSRGLRASSTMSSLTSVQQHEPLSIVPDPNHGIPFVPRIPKEFCDAMAAMAPSAAVVVPGEVKDDEGKEAGKGKTVNRDSGLGDDVENIPAWA